MDRDYEAFISYRHKECNPLAKALHDTLLSAYAINSFRDDEGLHFGDFRKQLVINNKKSRFLVLLLTPETLERCSKAGDWITKEVSLFLEKKKPIIPVKLGGFEFPENLPPEIEKLKEYDCNSIVCNIQDPDSAAEYIAGCVHAKLRNGWKPKHISECIVKKPYLSKENVSIDGYYAQSANKLRNTVFFLIPNLIIFFIYLFNCFRLEGGHIVYISGSDSLPYIFGLVVLVLFHLELLKFGEMEFGSKQPFSIIWMDYSELSALSYSWKWIILFVFAGLLFSLLGVFAIIIAAIFIDTNLFGASAANATGNSDRLMDLMVLCNFTTLSLVPTLRLIINGALELSHFLNSIFAKYPQRYLNWVRINRIQKIWKWVRRLILVPVVIALAVLALHIKVQGV